MKAFGLAAIFLHVTYRSCCAGTPVGHNKPLGSHKLPSVKIEEYEISQLPTPRRFFNAHVKLDKPAIFREASKESLAYKRWSDKYLREEFGDMEIRLEGKDKTAVPPIGETFLGRDSVRHFVDHYHEAHSNYDAVSDLPFAMYKDVGVIPSLGACGEMSRHFIEVDLRWNSGQSHSPLHKDIFNQMHCLIKGTKNFKLIEEKYEDYLYIKTKPGMTVEVESIVDPQTVNLLRYPNVANIQWSNVTLEAGDCIYIPKFYYHQDNSIGSKNLVVSIVFGRFDSRMKLDFSDCSDDTDYNKMRSLSEFPVQWIWEGTGTSLIGRADIEDIYRKGLLKHLRELKAEGRRFTQDEMENYKFIALIRESTRQQFGDNIEAFKIIDTDRDGIITEKEIVEMTTEQLRRVGDEIEPYEPSNTYEFEYSIITYDQVMSALQNSLLSKEKLLNLEWIKTYKALGGTQEKALEIFSRLPGVDGEYVISSKVEDGHIQHALENWVLYWTPQYAPEEMPQDEEGEGLEIIQEEDEQFLDEEEDFSFLFDDTDDEKDEL